MKCTRCPLFHSWSTESDSGEACALFGDTWDSQFQYEDYSGSVVGCYIDRHYIKKADEEIRQLTKELNDAASLKAWMPFPEQ